MPKLKTNRAAAKRFRKTAKGFKRGQSQKRHILTKKRPERKRELGQASLVDKADERKLKRLIGCG